MSKLRFLESFEQIDGAPNDQQFELRINWRRNQDVTLLFGFFSSRFCTLLVFLVNDVGPNVAQYLFTHAELFESDHLGDFHLVRWLLALQFLSPAKVNVDFEAERIVLVIAQAEPIVAD
jgi:hypothetical protein